MNATAIGFPYTTALPKGVSTNGIEIDPKFMVILCVLNNLRRKVLLHKETGMLKNASQVQMANIALVPLLFLSFLVFTIPIAVSWKKGKP